MIGLEIVYEMDTVAKSDAWQACCDLLEKFHLLESHYKLNGDRVFGFRVLEKKVARCKEFMLEGELATWGFAFTSYFLERYYFELRAGSVFPEPDAWVQQMLRCGEFVSARLFDNGYERWQNERSVDVCRRAGVDIDSLKLATEPVVGARVDISHNPGRTMGGKGFREGLGHVMWLAPRFFAASGTTVDAVSKAALEREMQSEYLRFVFSRESFSDSNPPPPDLRGILFPRSSG